MSNITFNCGEFKPGKRRIDDKKRPPPKGDNYIVKPNPGKQINPPIKRPPTFGGGTPAPPGPGPGVPGPPQYKCEETAMTYADSLAYCVINNTSPFLGVEVVENGVKRTCVKCTKDEVKNGICKTKDECKKTCVDTPPKCRLKGPTTGFGIEPDPGIIISNGQVVDFERREPGNNVDIRSSEIRNVNIPKRDDVTIVKDPTQIVNEHRQDRNIKIREIEFVNIDDEANSSLGNGLEASSGSIYNNYYNIIDWGSSDQYSFVENNRFLNIFNDVVTAEVYYFLELIDVSGYSPWHEYHLSRLNKSGVAISLKPDLLIALDSLSYRGGQLISLDANLETIIDLLLTGRLHEYDPSFYINLSKKQEAQEKVILIPSQDKVINEQAALGIIKTDAVFVNPDSNDPVQRPYLRRARALNTDIELNLPVTKCGGDKANVYSEEDGIRFNSINGVIKISDIAEGDGYYFSGLNLQAASLVLDTSSEASSAIFVDPGQRFNAMSLMGIAPEIRIEASSASGTSEYSSNYDTTSTLVPMYFKLDLSTVGSPESIDPLSYSTTATYTKLTAQEANTHARNNGYNVISVNIDYNDPFLVYANNSGYLNLTMNDISFKNFNPSRANTRNTIISRDTPQAIVLVPGSGSRHNPFFGVSQITNFRGNVSRVISIIPDIIPTAEEWRTSLSPSFVLNVENKKSLGLVETSDVDNVIFGFSENYYTSSYYYNGSFYSLPPSPRTISSVGRLIQVIDNLIARYKVKDKLTWYDVFRRLKAFEFFGLAREQNHKILTDWLEKGGRGKGISYILNREPLVKTGLGDVRDDSIDDTIYLQDSDRIFDTDFNWNR